VEGKMTMLSEMERPKIAMTFADMAKELANNFN